MKPIKILALGAFCLIVAGCAARQEPPATAPVYRDVTRPIAAAALFDINQLSGTWEVLAHYPLASTPCGAMRLQVAGDMGQLICLDDSATPRLLRQGAVRSGGTGRVLTDFGPDFEAPDLRVIWIAHDGDTAVLGTADGRAGFVLNRGSSLSADRWAAVREMLDFNGFDTAALQRR